MRASHADKKKDQAFVSKFPNQFAPEVIEELDAQQRPVQKVHAWRRNTEYTGIHGVHLLACACAGYVVFDEF